MRVGLHLLVAAEDGAPSPAVAPKDTDQAAAQVIGNLPQRQHATGSRGTFELEPVAVEFVELVKTFDDQVVDRHPDRTAPIGVSAEESAVRLGRNVSDFGMITVDLEDIGLVEMASRQGPNAVIRQEFALVQDALEHPGTAEGTHDREQTRIVGTGRIPA